MAAPTISELREAIALNLSAIADVQVNAYMMANPTPPAIHVFPEELEYDLAMGRGLDKVRFTVQAFAAMNQDKGAQQRLDLMLAPAGATSVKAAIESDRSLGGKAQDLRVTRSSGYKVFVNDGRTPILGSEWSVEVFTLGK